MTGPRVSSVALTHLGTYRSAMEADLIKAKLAAYGIESIVQSDAAGSGVPNLDLTQGVRVLVRDEDLPDALEVLERMLPG